MCRDSTHIIIAEFSTTDRNIAWPEVLPYEWILLIRDKGLNVDRLKKVLGWWGVRDPGWQWMLDCRDPKPDNQIND